MHGYLSMRFCFGRRETDFKMRSIFYKQTSTLIKQNPLWSLNTTKQEEIL